MCVWCVWCDIISATTEVVVASTFDYFNVATGQTLFFYFISCDRSWANKWMTWDHDKEHETKDK